MKSKFSLLMMSALFFVGSTSALSTTEVDSLTAKDVNTTFGSDELKFETREMNISLTPRTVFVPSKINDTVSTFSYSVSTWEKDSAVSSFSIQYKTIYEDNSYEGKKDSVRRVLGDDPNANNDLPQNQFVHSSSLYSEDSESKTFVFSNNFSDTDDNQKVRWNVSVSSQYENLVIDYTLQAYNSSLGSYQDVASYQDVYQSEEPEKLALSSIESGAYSLPTDNAVIDNKMVFDNRFDDAHNLTAVVVYPENGSFKEMETDGTSYQEWSTSFQYVKSRLRSANVSEKVILKDLSGYEFKAFNLTAPSDSQQYIGSTVSIPQSSSGRSYMYILGSGSGFATNYTVGGSSFKYGKQLNITNASGTPTIGSKAYPVHIVNGSGSNTGTGNITVDFDQFGTSDCSDLRFLNETDNGELDFEVEECDFNTSDNDGIKEIWTWVHIPEAVRDGNDEIHMYWGNESTVSSASDPSGTWGNSGQNAAMVQHLNGDALDSTSNDNDGTWTGESYETGEFADAGSFDGNDDYIDISGIDLNNTNNGGLSVVSWVNMDFDWTSDSSSYQFFRGKKDGSNNLGIVYNTAGEIQLSWSSSTVSPSVSQNRQGEWVQLVMSVDNASSPNVDFYVEGSNTFSGTFGSGETVEGSIPTEIARRIDNSGVHFDGGMDEVRFYDRNIDSDFAQADYDASPKGGQTFFNQTSVEESDSVAPNISYNPSTTNTGTFSRDWIFVNVTATDETSLSSVTEEFDGTNSSFNTNSGDYYWTNHTGLSDGSYSFEAYTTDGGGNTNSTSTRTVTLDTTAANVSIQSPSNKTYSTSSVDLNVTSDEAVNFTHNVEYSNGTTVISNTTNNENDQDLNITLSDLPNGDLVATVYGSDSVDNVGSDSVSFTVDATNFTGVQLNSSVQINQSSNNAIINVTESFTVDNLTVYSDATEFGGINWSIDGNKSDDINVNLSYFNDNNTVDTYLANYSVSSTTNNLITSSFVPRPVDSVYRVLKESSFFKEVVATSGKVANFTYTTSDTDDRNFSVLRVDDRRPQINRTKYYLDIGSGNEKLYLDLYTFGENDLSSNSGPGTEDSFSNTSLVRSVSTPFTTDIVVTDVNSYSRTKPLDLSKSDSGWREDDFSHDLSTQQTNQTVDLTNNAGESLDYNISFENHGTVVSGSEEVSSSVGSSSSVSDSVVWSNDYLTETEYDFSPDTNEVTLGVNYLGSRALEIANSASVQFTGVNTTAGITDPTGCSQSNNSEIDIGSGATTNFSVESSCDPGNIGNPTQTINNVSADKERIWYNSTDMEIKTNETENTKIAIRANKDNLKNPDKRDGGSLKAYVEGNSTVEEGNELNVTDTGTYFRITVGTGFQTSSLHTDDTDWSVTYTLSGENTTVVSGGGGGGTEDTSQIIYFGSVETSDGIETVNVPFGETVVRNMTVTNERQSPTTANVFVGDDPICQYIDVETSLGSNEFSDNGVYQLDAAQQTLGTVETTESFRIRYSLPNRTVLSDAGVENMSCGFETTSSFGTAEPLVIELGEGLFPGLGSFFENFPREICFEVPVGSINSNATAEESVESDSSTVCFPVWGIVLAALIFLGLLYLRRTRGGFL